MVKFVANNAMNNNAFKTSAILSVFIILLSLLASAGGLFTPLYNDNALVQAAWKGNDMVTLILAIPLMIISLILSSKGSKRGLLAWLGMLLYMLYNYMFYLYGAVFNELFLVYTAIFTLSAYALVFGLSGLNIKEIANCFHKTKAFKWVSGFILFFAILLAGIWILMSVNFVFDEKVPLAITQTGHPTGVVFATDLSVLIPLMIISAVKLWQSRPWGYILTAMVLTKATTYGIALILMSEIAFSSTGHQDPLTFLWVILTIGCIFSSWIVFKNLESSKAKTTNIC